MVNLMKILHCEEEVSGFLAGVKRREDKQGSSFTGLKNSLAAPGMAGISLYDLIFSAHKRGFTIISEIYESRGAARLVYFVMGNTRSD